MRAAVVYIRFSSDQQADGSSIERQTAAIEAYARRADLTLVAPYLIDDGFSAFKGDHIDNGKLGRFLKEVDAGRHRGRALVVEDLDRLSRLGIDKTQEILRRLLKGDVLLHIASENRVVRDLDDMMTAIFNVIKSSTAKEYTEKLSERIRGGWARAKAAAAKGEIVTKNLPAWLTIVGGKIVENEKAAVLREAFQLAGLGVGSKKILRKLKGSLDRGSKGYSLSWLSRTMCNRAVLGEYQPCRYVNGQRVPDGEPIPNYFPQIIDQSEWEAARTEIARKNRIPDDKRYRGGDRHSDVAKNLFSGLLKDVTSQPERGMGFAEVNGIQYLSSVFSADGRKSNRLHYQKFEKAFLGFLRDLDWKSVAGASESDEEKAAKAELETVLSELDRAVRLVAVKTRAADEETDVAASRFLAAQIARLEDRVSTLEAEKTRLGHIVDAARAKCNALHSPEALLALIAAGDNETRLRLRTEIRRRVRRIEFTFNATFLANTELARGGWTMVRISFVSGVERAMLAKGDGYVLYTPAARPEKKKGLAMVQDREPH
jgi:DNA invertase Pin-like site-specific DNA recombinase